VNHVYPLESAIPDTFSPNGWGDVESWTVSGLRGGENWLQIVAVNCHAPPSGYIANAAGLVYRLKISYHVPTEVAINLVPGWNLVSVPLIGHGYNSSTLGLLTGDIVAGWNPATQTYDKIYVVGVSLPFKDFAIEANTGYWIMATASETLNLPGTIPTGTQARAIVVPGPGSWAIMGVNSYRTDMHASDLVVNYSSGSVTQVASYNTATGAYKTYNPLLPFTDFLLVPGLAYWIMVTGSGTLTYLP
jgi:hypothetical protein